jgi:hypothetical protein
VVQQAYLGVNPEDADNEPSLAAGGKKSAGNEGRT